MIRDPYEWFDPEKGRQRWIHTPDRRQGIRSLIDQARSAIKAGFDRGVTRDAIADVLTRDYGVSKAMELSEEQLCQFIKKIDTLCPAQAS